MTKERNNKAAANGILSNNPEVKSLIREIEQREQEGAEARRGEAEAFIKGRQIPPLPRPEELPLTLQAAQREYIKSLDLFTGKIAEWDTAETAGEELTRLFLLQYLQLLPPEEREAEGKRLLALIPKALNPEQTENLKEATATAATLVFYITTHPEKLQQQRPDTDDTKATPKIKAHPAETTTLPLDKLTQVIYNIAPIQKRDGNNKQIYENGYPVYNWRPSLEGEESLRLYIDMATDKERAKGKQALVKAVISQPELIKFINEQKEKGRLRITRELDTFDYSVQIAAASLYEAGNEYTTTSQIYNQMGGKGYPNREDYKRIRGSLKKQRETQILVDNTQIYADGEDVSEARMHTHTAEFKYQGALLPNEIAEAIIDGQTVKEAIRILATPPLIRYAKTKGQIYTIPKKALKTPLDNRRETEHLKQYLLQRIGRMHHRGISDRIAYETVYITLGVEYKSYIAIGATPAQRKSRAKEGRQRVRGKISKLLDYWKTEEGGNLIQGYTADKNGVTIALKKGE